MTTHRSSKLTSTKEPELADRPTGSDCRTFLKRLALVAPLGLVGEPEPLDADLATDTFQTAEDTWQMVGYDPAHTGFNRVAAGPEQPVGVTWRFEEATEPTGSPVVVGDTLYVGTDEGTLFALT